MQYVEEFWQMSYSELCLTRPVNNFFFFSLSDSAGIVQHVG